MCRDEPLYLGSFAEILEIFLVRLFLASTSTGASPAEPSSYTAI